MAKYYVTFWQSVCFETDGDPDDYVIENYDDLVELLDVDCYECECGWLED